MYLFLMEMAELLKKNLYQRKTFLLLSAWDNLKLCVFFERKSFYQLL